MKEKRTFEFLCKVYLILKKKYSKIYQKIYFYVYKKLYISYQDDEEIISYRN